MAAPIPCTPTTRAAAAVPIPSAAVAGPAAAVPVPTTPVPIAPRVRPPPRGVRHSMVMMVVHVRVRVHAAGAADVFGGRVAVPVLILVAAAVPVRRAAAAVAAAAMGTVLLVMAVLLIMCLGVNTGRAVAVLTALLGLLRGSFPIGRTAFLGGRLVAVIAAR